jgi:hypothetical protein
VCGSGDIRITLSLFYSRCSQHRPWNVSPFCRVTLPPHPNHGAQYRRTHLFLLFLPNLPLDGPARRGALPHRDVRGHYCNSTEGSAHLGRLGICTRPHWRALLLILAECSLPGNPIGSPAHHMEQQDGFSGAGCLALSRFFLCLSPAGRDRDPSKLLPPLEGQARPGGFTTDRARADTDNNPSDLLSLVIMTIAHLTQTDSISYAQRCFSLVCLSVPPFLVRRVPQPRWMLRFAALGVSRCSGISILSILASYGRYDILHPRTSYGVTPPHYVILHLFPCPYRGATYGEGHCAREVDVFPHAGRSIYRPGPLPEPRTSKLHTVFAGTGN